MVRKSNSRRGTHGIKAWYRLPGSALQTFFAYSGNAVDKFSSLIPAATQKQEQEEPAHERHDLASNLVKAKLPMVQAAGCGSGRRCFATVIANWAKKQQR